MLSVASIRSGSAAKPMRDLVSPLPVSWLEASHLA